MAQFVKIWFDLGADFLEVRFSDELGYMREPENNDLMERVNINGQVIGFSIFQISTLPKDKPLFAQLAAVSS